jgi:hypothetical protein
MIFFETQGDEGDKDRVMLNLIQLAAEEGKLERTETKEEIRFKGLIEVKI